jgi:hypothetical protein
LKSPIGKRITFKQSDLPTHLQTCKDSYDYIVLCQCIWYFDTSDILRNILDVCKGRAKRLLIAEYSLHASHPDAHAHVLAALACAALETRSPSDMNIRTVISPSQIKKMASTAGWSLMREQMLTPDDQYLEGRWEVQSILRDAHQKRLMTSSGSDRDRDVDIAFVDAIQACILPLKDGARSVRSMDIWFGVYELNEKH